MTTYNAPDTEFNAVGPGLNAWNMRSQQWLDESRVWQCTGNAVDETVTLRPLVRRDLSGFLAAELIGDPDVLIEFRVQEGWDAGIPRPAVLIHRFDAGHSYVMRGNSGSLDLIAGDTFGDADPGQNPINPFSPFRRVEVLSIDPSAEEATLRIRCYIPSRRLIGGLAIDPMALILHGSAYLKWVEQKHPHEPKVADIRAALKEMTPREQKAALDRAKTLVTYGNAVEEALGTSRQ